MARSGEGHDGKIVRGDSPRAHPKGKIISPEQKQRIHELYVETRNGHEVARRMGIGSTSVYRHLKLGGNKPRWSDDDDQAVIDGYAEKRKVKEIAKQVRRTERAVILHMHWHREKVKSDPKKRRALSAISLAFKAVRRADIFRELTE